MNDPMSMDALARKLKNLIAVQTLELRELLQNSIGATQKQTLTAAEAACYLGIAKSTLYKMVMRGDIAYYKVSGGRKVIAGKEKASTGGRLFFAREDLDAWMRSNRVASKREIEEAAQSESLKKTRR